MHTTNYENKYIYILIRFAQPNIKNLYSKFWYRIREKRQVFRRDGTLYHPKKGGLSIFVLNLNKINLFCVPVTQHSGSQMPKLLETIRRVSTSSETYPSLAFSLDQRPCFLKSRSGTPRFAASVAPPLRKECIPKSFRFSPIS